MDVKSIISATVRFKIKDPKLNPDGTIMRDENGRIVHEENPRQIIEVDDEGNRTVIYDRDAETKEKELLQEKDKST